MGSQRQGDRRTVQGELERAVAEVFGRSIPVYLAGRTDQGVHAAGQVASFGDYRPEMSNETVAKALTAHCPDDLSVLEVGREPLGFHARHDAKWREYRYWLWCGNSQPLARRTVWCEQRRPLDARAMDEAAGQLLGAHDFASFAAGGEGVPGSARQDTKRGTKRNVFTCCCIEQINWWGAHKADGNLYMIRIVADGFLPRMVRGIVGAVVEVGRGQHPAEWIAELLEIKDRRKGPMNAPAHGLTLWNVGYGLDEPGQG